MCIPIGVMFKCGCSWRGWWPCGPNGCDIQNVCGDGLPPEYGIVGEARRYIITKYRAWTRTHQTFLRVELDCGPECCQSSLESVDPYKLDALLKHADRHIKLCTPNFCQKIGKLNSMRLDPNDAHTQGRPLHDLKRILPSTVYDKLDKTPVRQYELLYQNNAGLQKPPNLPPLQQYIKIRGAALADPKNVLHDKFQPPDDLLTAFQNLQDHPGDKSAGPAKAGFDREEVQNIAELLREVVASRVLDGELTKGNQSLTAGMASLKTEPGGQQGLRALAPASLTPLGEAARPGLSAEAVIANGPLPALTSFNEVWDACTHVAMRAQRLPPLPERYVSPTAADEVRAVRRKEFEPLHSDLDKIESAVNDGAWSNLERQRLRERVRTVAKDAMMEKDASRPRPDTFDSAKCFEWLSRTTRSVTEDLTRLPDLPKVYPDAMTATNSFKARKQKLLLLLEKLRKVQAIGNAALWTNEQTATLTGYGNQAKDSLIRARSALAEHMSETKQYFDKMMQTFNQVMSDIDQRANDDPEGFATAKANMTAIAHLPPGIAVESSKKRSHSPPGSRSGSPAARGRSPSTIDSNNRPGTTGPQARGGGGAGRGGTRGGGASAGVRGRGNFYGA